MSINFSRMSYLQSSKVPWQSYTSRKDIANEDFNKKLMSLRQEMRSEKLKPKAKPKEDTDKIGVMEKFAPNQKLFSKWDNNLSVDEQLKKLDDNLSLIGKFSFSSDISVEESIEHLASQYAIYKDHLKNNSSSEQMKKLEKIMEKHLDKYAKSFAEEVGGFYEKNGKSGEKDKMYRAIKERVALTVSDYSGFLSSNRGEFDAIRQADSGSVSLSFELRRLYREAGNWESGGINLPYKKQELSEAAALAGVAKEILTSSDFGAVSEEELGVRFGETLAKGLEAMGKSKVHLYFKDAFQKAVQSHIDSSLEKIDATLTEQSKNSSSQNTYKSLDKNAVELVMKSVIDSYNHSKSVTKAVSIGKEFGMFIFLSKKDWQNGVARYQKSEYFEEKSSKMLQWSKGDLSKIKRAALASMTDYQSRLFLQNQHQNSLLNKSENIFDIHV